MTTTSIPGRALLLTSPAVARQTQVDAARRIRTPADFPTIQAGIDAASHGDVVLVSPGTYFENLALDGKAIVLASEFLTTGSTSTAAAQCGSRTTSSSITTATASRSACTRTPAPRSRSTSAGT